MRRTWWFNPFNLTGEGWDAGGLAETCTNGKRRTMDWSESEFLELRQVNVARGDRVVLHDVNLTVAPGSMWRFWGRTGAGSRR
jgi:ABC-type molybdenum transport system ATPase subunit/photorepair protein PhrA